MLLIDSAITLTILRWRCHLRAFILYLHFRCRHERCRHYAAADADDDTSLPLTATESAMPLRYDEELP